MTELQIIEGRFYKTRSGRNAGPMEVPPPGKYSSAYVWECRSFMTDETGSPAWDALPSTKEN